MSKTIDQRVVEMQFDNRQFESGVKTSMSTIDRLKQSLNFKDAGKGFESISTAAKKVDMNGLAQGVEAVQVKFSSLQVIATTALANITNAAVNAGKNLISSFTLDPITQGFQEYETQMNAVQTILANTQSKGTTLDEVKNALAELNTYADQTIYNFTEMTRNIGTFTAAGVDLDKSVTSIKGIANLAAVSGSNAQQASTAMYQLSQALAAGVVKYQDWISVRNAGMGGEVFKTALKRTAENFGYHVDEMIEKYGSFDASLTEGQWLTAEVLTETLTQLSGAYTEADLIAQGYSEQQAKEIVELANTAVDAATKVKTFTQLIDTMKEAVGSGWAQTWQLIIGDFEEAKELWTGISDFFTGENGIITKMSTARNTILEGALYGNPFSDLAKRIDSVTSSTDKMTSSTKDYSSVVDKVINGDFGNGKERVDALTKANYDYAHAQNLVNEKLGSSVRHATDYKEAQEGISKTTKTTAEDLVKLSDAQLVMMGFTQAEVDALRDLEEQSEKTGIPLNKLIENVDQLNGRTLLINSFKNAAKGLVQVFTSISDGWRKAFWGDASEDDILSQKTDRLYNLIAALHKFSQNLVMSEDTVNKLTRTFEGLFAILDLVSTILGGGFKLAFEVVSKLLGAFDLNLLDVTATIGDAAVALRDFLLNNELVNKGFDLLASGIVSVVKAIKGWVDAFLELPIVQAGIENFKNMLSNLKDVGLDAIEGLKNGLQNGITSIPEILMEIGRRILDAIKGVLGIHSPSTEMYTVGQNIIEGLINGIKDFASNLWEFLSGIGDGIVEIFSQIDWGNVFVALLSAGGIVALYKFASALSAITAPLEGLGDVFEGVGNVLDAFSGTIKSFNFKMKAEAIKTFAIAIAILAGSVAVLSFIPAGQLWNAVGVIAALSAVIAGLSIAIGKFGNGSIVDVAKISGLLLALSSSFLILAGVMKIISGMSWDDLTKATAGLMALGMIITGLVAATRIGGDEVSKAGGTILKIAVAMGALVLVGKLIAGMEWSELGKAGAGLVGLSAIVTGLLAATKLAGNGIDKAGGTILKIAVAMGALVLVSKLIVGMEWSEMGKAAIGLIGLSAIVAGLIAITKLAGNDIDKVGGTILKISIAMSALVLVSKLIVGMKWSEMGKAAVGLVGLSAIVAGLILITNLAPEKDLAKLGITLLMISTSIGILAGISVLLGLVKTENLIKGITAVGALSALMSMMIVATGFAKRSKGLMGNIIAITVAIGVMAAAVAGLSFIEPGRLITVTAAMSVLMGMFALIVKSSQNISGAMGPLIVMTAAIGVLAGALYLLSGLPIEVNVANAAALSMLLLSLSASMTIISKAGKVSGSALASMGVLTAVVAGLAVILGALAYLDVVPSIETVTALSIMLLAMSGVTAILSLVGMAGGAGTALNGVLGLATVVGGVGVLLAALGGINELLGGAALEFINKGIPILSAIASGLGQAVGSLISGLGAGLTSGLPAISDNLSLFMTNLQPFIEGAKQIDGSILGSIGTLAGVILALTAADVIQGIASFFGLGGDLASFAQQLVPFGEAMAEFGATINGKLDPSSMEAAATAGNMLAALNSSLPRQGGALQDFLGTQDLSVFGEQLKEFGNAMVSFSQTVSGKIDQASIEAAAAGGQSLAELNKTLPRQGGALQEFLGSQDLGVFGEQLKKFGECIVSFSATVTGKVDQAGVEAAAAAGQTLAELNKNLPNQEGWMQEIFGKQDLALFGEQLKQFGSAIVSFSQTVAGKVDQSAVESATAAGEALAALNEKLPKQNGWAQAIFGEQDMALFGAQLVAFGTAFAMYSALMGLVDTNVVTTTTNAADSLVTLADAVSEIETGGWFSNSTTLGDFGDQLTEFGSKFAEFYGTISGIGSFTLSIVVSELGRLADLASTVSAIDMSGMSSFGKALTNLAKADIEGVVSTYTDAYTRVESAVQGLVDSMSSGVESNGSKFVSSVSNMIEESLTNIRNQNPDFTKSGQDLVTNLATGITNKESDPVKAFTEILETILETISQNGSKFTESGKELVTKLSTGIKSEAKTAQSSFESTLSAMITSIKGKYSNFYDAGKYLVQGFANGINQNTYLATAQARAMASAADSAARSQLGVHSPSTVFYMVGGYVVEGFVKGISDNIPKVENSAEDLGESVVDSTEESLDVKSGSSELAKKVIGESFVNGIAEGITESMSAEEAAEKKAENIVEAFANAMEKIDFSSDTLDLEQQLWDSVNENLTTDAQKDAAQMQTLLKQYEYQQQRLELAKAEYDTMIQEFGEQSQEARESYNRYLQEQIDLADLSNQIIDLKDAEVDREMDILDQRDELLQHEYEIWKNKNAATISEAEEALADLALLTDQYSIQLERVNSAQSKYQAILSMFGENANETYEAYNEYLSQYEELTSILSQIDESRDAIKEDRGYSFDIDDAIIELKRKIQNIVPSVSQIVQSTVEESFGESLLAVEPDFTGQGEAYAEAVGESIQNGLSLLGDSTKNAIEEGASSISTETSFFATLGEQVASSFISGIQNSLASLSETFNTLTQTMMSGLTSALVGGTDKLLDSGSSIEMGDQDVSVTLTPSAGIVEAGEQIVTVIIMGIESQENELRKSFAVLLEVLIDTTNKKYGDFYKAGGYLVEGFAAGISANSFKAASAARSMANAAYNAAMSALDAHSPSRLFMEVGSYVPLGFAQGISSAEKVVESSATSMANSAIQTTKDALSRIVDVINSDVDTEPTIRPVLDLTNVEAGTKRLNAMFSRNRAMSISSGMNRRSSMNEDNQNGAQIPQSAPVYNFNQYNTSPKALSRIEIYRQTNNQFSAFERVTKV